MKKYKLPITFIILIIGAVLVLILSSILVICKEDILGKPLYTILMDTDKALIVTVIIGSITKLVADDILLIKKDNDKLRKIGIISIGESRLDYKQANIMFGSNLYKYPDELKFLFISGNNFMAVFKDRIVKAINNGCNVKILIADKKKSKEFLERAESLCPQRIDEGSYISQVDDTYRVVKEIMTLTKEGKGSLEVRHYHDEYRYNYRLGLYGDTIRLWANFQPQNKDAVDLSLSVNGIYDKNNKNKTSSDDKTNIVLNLNESFDYLWDKYKDTSNKYLPK